MTSRKKRPRKGSVRLGVHDFSRRARESRVSKQEWLRRPDYYGRDQFEK